MLLNLPGLSAPADDRQDVALVLIKRLDVSDKLVLSLR